MQYVKAYTYFTSKPGGGKNLGWVSLALFSTSIVPLLGQLVVLGYQAEVGDDLKRDPDLAEYPDFDLNRFVPYLNRCIWPFLTQLIVGLVFGMLLLVVVVAGFAVAALTDKPLAGIAVGAVGYFPIILAMMVVLWPMTLYAQFRQEFDFGGALRFTADFLRKVGGQLFVCLLVHTVIVTPLTFVGMLLCCIGLYPVLAVAVMAQEHFLVQLYRLYLDEGGTPIPSPGDADELAEPDMATDEHR